MRFNDFKIAESKQKLDELVQNPALANPDDMDANQALQFIASQSKDADESTKQKVLKYLDKFIAALSGQPTVTNESLDDAINDRVQRAAELLAEQGITPDKENYLQLVAKFFMEEGAQIGHSTLNAIKISIEELYAPLANKIIGGGAAFAPEVPEPDPKADPAVAAAAKEYAQEMKIKRSELSKTGQAVADTIRDMVQTVIDRAQRQEAIKDAEAELKRVKEFVELCVNDPFINFDQLVNKTHGTVENEFAQSPNGSKFIDIYNQFENILGRTIDKAGAGAWGPGELGLLMLADPVRKGQKGDIETASGKQVEVKASKKAGSGARLNVEQATKGNLTRDYNEVLVKYFGPTIYVDDKQVTVNHQTDLGQVNFTIKGFNILNRWVEELRKEKKWKKATAINFLIDSVNIPMKNYVGETGYDQQLKDSMSRVVTKEGLFSFDAFQREFTKLLFSIYKSEMLDCILVINPIMGTFLVMNDPEDVDATVDRGLVISGGIDFKDKQSTKSPQIGVGQIAS